MPKYPPRNPPYLTANQYLRRSPHFCNPSSRIHEILNTNSPDVQSRPFRRQLPNLTFSDDGQIEQASQSDRSPSYMEVVEQPLSNDSYCTCTVKCMTPWRRLLPATPPPPPLPPRNDVSHSEQANQGDSHSLPYYTEIVEPPLSNSSDYTLTVQCLRPRRRLLPATPPPPPLPPRNDVSQSKQANQGYVYSLPFHMEILEPVLPNSSDRTCTVQCLRPRRLLPATPPPPPLPPRSHVSQSKQASQSDAHSLPSHMKTIEPALPNIRVCACAVHCMRPRRLLPATPPPPPLPPRSHVSQSKQASQSDAHSLPTCAGQCMRPRRLLPATPPLPPLQIRPLTISAAKNKPAGFTSTAGNDISWPRYIRGYYVPLSVRILDQLEDLEAKLRREIRAKKELRRRMMEYYGEDSSSTSSSSSSSFDELRFY